jgi:guanylate kinase
LEWEEVYKGTKYGSIRAEIQKIWDKDHVAIFDIDIMGALRIKKELNQNLLSVFVAPPSMEVLYQRLNSRNTETPEKIKTRMDKATEEMRFQNIFDVKVVNDEIHTAYQFLKARVDKFLNTSH